MRKKIFTALGLMSGTSMDGVDLSLIKSDGDNEFSLILNDFFEFDGEFQKKLIKLRKKIIIHEDLKTYSRELDELEKQFTLFNVQIIHKVLNNYNDQIDLIGFHGQTVFHDPNKKMEHSKN